MSNQELVNYLKDCGACQVCQLRYLKARGTEYANMPSTFRALNVEYDDDVEDVIKKRQRPNTCPTCLDLFSEEFKSDLLEAIIGSDINKFENDSVVVAISLPILLQIRQLSMWFALLRKFGKNKIHLLNNPGVPLKEAVKLILNPIVCKKLNKSYNVNDGIRINISLSHTDENAEMEEFQKLDRMVFPSSNGKKEPKISRGYLEKQYVPQNISDQLFEKFLTIPPLAPNAPLTLESITLTGPTVCVAGRYRKLVRQLSHTPWILDGKRVAEDSIEEIIIRNVASHFCDDVSKVIFMSSGREDVDVRCLGNGRPFALEIPNSKRMSLSKELAFEMETEINKSFKISVINLQMVKREDLIHIKAGEEKKKKFYRALCKLEQSATPELMEKLNIPNGFEIDQKTPIRVLHRRALHTRPRTIYSIKARVHKKNHRMLILDIVSQAGTYIKELIHGEFGRTKPSIKSIIEQPIDIIALDVMGIDLDWPPNIDNSV